MTLRNYHLIKIQKEKAYDIFFYSKIRSAMELKGTIIGPNDYIIAATVLAKNGILVTHNTKEFGKVKNLKIEDWTMR
ncbi:MAG: hypothetical protein Kow00102_02120 [Spirochaetota bacterium]